MGHKIPVAVGGMERVDFRHAAQLADDAIGRFSHHLDHHDGAHAVLVEFGAHPNGEADKDPGFHQPVETVLNRAARDAQDIGQFRQGRAAVDPQMGNDASVEIIRSVEAGFDHCHFVNPSNAIVHSAQVPGGNNTESRLHTMRQER